MYKEPTKEQLQYRIEQLEKVLKELLSYVDNQPTLLIKDELKNIINKGIGGV